MAHYLNLQLPAPCSENWNNMAPTSEGRFCFSCQKAVIDFTQMTDQELVNYFKTYQGPTCGRFTQSQLSRNIAVPKKPLPWVKYFFRYTLPAFLLSLKSSAPLHAAGFPIEVTPSYPSISSEDTSGSGTIIKGTITDEAGSPINGATIIIKGTTLGTTSNSTGQFELVIDKSNETIVVSSVGYQTKEVLLDTLQQELHIRLSLQAALLGEVVVAGYVLPHKRKRKEETKSKKQQKENSYNHKFLAYPNPVIIGSKLKLQYPDFEKGTYLLQWYTLTGALVQTSRQFIDGEKEISLLVSQLLPGSYLLKIIHEKSGKQYSHQIVVQP